jgi:uncharacterized protein (DUF849 family)
MEDNPYYRYGATRSDASNPRLVERVVRIARELGREPATPDQARAIIGLRPVDRTQTGLLASAPPAGVA